MMDMKRTAIALNGSVFLLMLGVGLITPVLPGKIYHFTQSTVQVGNLAATFAFSYVLVQVPMGVWADRLGYKNFIVLGYILCGIAGCLYLMANSSVVLLVGRVIQGFGEAPLWALAPAMLSIIYSNSKGKEIGRYNASIHLGLTAGSISGFFILRHFTEDSVFQIYILLCCISALWIYVSVQEKGLIPSRRRDRSTQDHKQKLILLGKPSTFAIVNGITLYGVGYGVFMTIIPAYISQSGLFENDLSGILFIAFYLGITLSQCIGGPIADKIGRLTPMVAGLSFYSLGMLLISYVSSVMIFFIFALSSFGLGLFLVGSLAFLNDQVDTASKGFVSGLFYFFWGGGYCFGPIIMGYVSEKGLMANGFGALGLIGVITVFLIIGTCRDTNTFAETYRKEGDDPKLIL